MVKKPYNKKADNKMTYQKFLQKTVAKAVDKYTYQYMMVVMQKVYLLKKFHVKYKDVSLIPKLQSQIAQSGI